MEAKIKVYGPRLFGLCMTLCRNQQDAWDLYQDTWLRAYEKQEQFKENMSYEAWLTSICVNRYKDILRRIKISPIFDGFASDEEKMVVFENAALPQEADFSDVRDAVDKLPSKFREVVILFYFEDKDVKKTAAILKVPEGTVKSRLMKARKMLKEVLNDEWNI
jgi:RNA polymerase sigma-70 factor (ECF subfamily)